MKNDKKYKGLSKEELLNILLEKESTADSWKNKYERLEADFKKLQIKLNKALKELEILKEKNILARIRQFAAKTEKDSEYPNEFNEAETVLKEEPKKRGRVKGSTNFDYAYLESHVSQTEIIEPEQKSCKKCGEVLVDGGEDVSYKINYIPPKLEVVKRISKKLVCKKCNSIYQKSSEDNFPHSICTPSLASAIMTNKFLVGIPYYRQSLYFFNEGIELSRQDLCNYQLKATELLEPLYKRLKVHLLNTSSRCLCADETTVRVLNENDRYKSYMWVYLSSYYDLPIYYYEYNKDRSHANPSAFLDGFNGYLLTDAYSGYNNIKGVLNCYCWAHTRRKFFEIVKSLKKEQLPDSKAYGMVKLIDVLLSKEKEMREKNLTPSEIKRIRNSEEYLADLERIKIEAESISAAPESALGKAVNYLLSRWEGFTRFLEDGHIELTNNISERAIKPFVIARKNFLFNVSCDGARSSAVFFSLQQTARANMLDSEKYVTKVLKLIKPDMSEKELDKLLPWELSKAYNLQ